MQSWFIGVRFFKAEICPGSHSLRGYQWSLKDSGARVRTRIARGIFRAGKRQAWTPIRSHWCGHGVLVGCGIRHAKRMLKRWKGLKRVTRGLDAQKKPWCGLGVLVGCGLRHAKRMCKRWKGLKRVTPGERHAGPPRRSDGCGLGVAFACAVGRSEMLLQGFKGFKFFRDFKGL